MWGLSVGPHPSEGPPEPSCSIHHDLKIRASCSLRDQGIKNLLAKPKIPGTLAHSPRPTLASAGPFHDCILLGGGSCQRARVSCPVPHVLLLQGQVGRAWSPSVLLLLPHMYPYSPDCEGSVIETNFLPS